MSTSAPAAAAGDVAGEKEQQQQQCPQSQSNGAGNNGYMYRPMNTTTSTSSAAAADDARGPADDDACDPLALVNQALADAEEEQASPAAASAAAAAAAAAVKEEEEGEEEDSDSVGGASEQEKMVPTDNSNNRGQDHGQDDTGMGEEEPEEEDASPPAPSAVENGSGGRSRSRSAAAVAKANNCSSSADDDHQQEQEQQQEQQHRQPRDQQDQEPTMHRKQPPIDQQVEGKGEEDKQREQCKQEEDEPMKAGAEETKKVEEQDEGWTCHGCRRRHDATRKRCPNCRSWKGGKRPMPTRPAAASSSSSYRTTPAVKTFVQPDLASSASVAGSAASGSVDGDAALAMALMAAERAKYRRRAAVVRAKRFEPGGNPNVLDSDSAVVAVTSDGATPDARVDSTSSRHAASVAASGSAAASCTGAAISSSDDQLTSDALLAAQLAQIYAGNAPLSAAEKVKFGGRRRGQVSRFQPGGNPRHTNPAEEYDMPWLPTQQQYQQQQLGAGAAGTAGAGSTSGNKRARTTSPTTGQPRISWRRPGRLTKEEEEKLQNAERATVERLRGILHSYREEVVDDDEMQGENTERGSGAGDIGGGDGDATAAGTTNGGSPAARQLSGRKRKRIQKDLITLLSEQRARDVGGVESLTISCKPATLALSREEIIEANRQMRSSLGIGCTVSLSVAEDAPRIDLEDVDALSNHISAGLQTSSADELRDMALHLLCYAEDRQEDVVEAMAAFSEMRKGGNNMLKRCSRDDLVFWADNDKASGRGLAFLHRLMRPLCVKVQVIQEKKDDSKEGGSRLDRSDFDGLLEIDEDFGDLFGPSTPENEEGLHALQYSLLDVLLQSPILQPHLVEGIFWRIQLLHQARVGAVEGACEVFQRLLFQAIEPLMKNNRLITGFLCTLLASFQGANREKLRQIILEELSSVIYPEQLSDDVVENAWVMMPAEYIEVSGRRNKAQHSQEARSCWAINRDMQLAIRKERKRLLQEFENYHARYEDSADGEESPRRSSRQVIPKGRSPDGSLIFSENEMTIDEFIKRKRLMKAVNGTFERQYIQGVSKPTLSQLRLSDFQVKELQDVFFDADGSLRNDIKLEIDCGLKNDPRYIVFFNSKCDAERRDTRWQVPVRHHGVGSVIEIRKRVEDIFSKANILVQGCEELDDIGLLFGGTEDQSLHHDTARQLTSWMKHRPLANRDEIVEYKSIPGWEIDRLEYNAAMASPYAPGSLLVGLHGGDTVYLGVQKDYVLKCADGKSCKIRGGRKDETFPIIRENDHLVVVEAKRGVMFTGDTPHAGVRNFPRDSEQQRLMDKLNAKLAEINLKYPAHERVLRTKATVAMMTSFPGLNKLCRLHCSTVMLKGNLLVPDNMVGFDGCLPNPPDTRCYEGDQVIDDTVAQDVGQATRKDAGVDRVTTSDNGTIEPAPELGPGWKVRKVKRPGGKTAGIVDKTFYSPDGKKFRSTKAANEYLVRSSSANAEDSEPPRQAPPPVQDVPVVTPLRQPSPSLPTSSPTLPPPSYEGERVIKFFRGELNEGTVKEHDPNSLHALIRWDDGDFELIRTFELKNLLQLRKEKTQKEELARPAVQKKTIENGPKKGSIEVKDSGDIAKDIHSNTTQTDNADNETVGKGESVAGGSSTRVDADVQENARMHPKASKEIRVSIVCSTERSRKGKFRIATVNADFFGLSSGAAFQRSANDTDVDGNDKKATADSMLQTQRNPAETVNGRMYVGKRVAMGFGGFRFDGTVKEYKPRDQLWRIRFDDGDIADMDISEVNASLALYNANLREGAKLCTLLSCDKISQGAKCQFMCANHYRMHGTPCRPSLQSEGPVKNQQKTEEPEKKKQKREIQPTYLSGSSPHLATPANPNCHILYRPADEACLSPPICVLRANIEAFAATEADVETSEQPIVAGQVGLRCCHCRHLPLDQRTKLAVTFPSSICSVYEAVRSFRRYHFNKCEAIPQSVRYEFDRVRQKQNKGQASEYWMQSCLELGMIDMTGDAGGIRFGPNEGSGGVADVSSLGGEQEEAFALGSSAAVGAGEQDAFSPDASTSAVDMFSEKRPEAPASSTVLLVGDSSIHVAGSSNLTV